MLSPRPVTRSAHLAAWNIFHSLRKLAAVAPEVPLLSGHFNC